MQAAERSLRRYEHGIQILYRRSTENKMPHEYHNRCFPFTFFVFVCEGTYFCRSDEQELNVGCGETLIVPPHIFHHVKMEESGILNWAHISLLIDDTDLSSVLTACEKPYKITGIGSEKTKRSLMASIPGFYETRGKNIRLRILPNLRICQNGALKNYK